MNKVPVVGVVVMLLGLVYPSWGADTDADRGGRNLSIEEVRAEAGLQRESRMWVLAVGVSKYAEAQMNLKYAAYDAETIARLFKAQEGLLYKEVNTLVLEDEEATGREILRQVDEFLGQAVPGDVVVIFMAGHGVKDRKTGTYYFVTYNANRETLFYDGLAMPMFEEACRRLQQRVDKLVLLTDTCHAGSLEVGERSLGTTEDLSEVLAMSHGRYILSGSEGGEVSYEHANYRFKNEKEGHGAFTYSLLRGLLGGAARDNSNVVRVSDLFGFVNRDVPDLTQGRQHPHSQLKGSDLPLFVLDKKHLAGFSNEAVVPIATIRLPKLQMKTKRRYRVQIGGGGNIGAWAVGESSFGNPDISFCWYTGKNNRIIRCLGVSGVYSKKVDGSYGYEEYNVDGVGLSASELVFVYHSRMGPYIRPGLGIHVGKNHVGYHDENLNNVGSPAVIPVSLSCEFGFAFPIVVLNHIGIMAGVQAVGLWVWVPGYADITSFYPGFVSRIYFF